MREVVIVCPELEAGAGGLADYTLRVAENWPSSTPLRFIVPEGEHREGSPKVTTISRRAEALLAALPQGGGAVLLQYSAYGFDHYGYPRWLLRALLDWKCRTQGVLVIMLHEIWTFWPIVNKNYFVQHLHRRDLRKLLGQADAVFTSTASQAEHLRALLPQQPVEMLPVGSNVRPVATSPAPREAGLAVLFGLQGTRCRTLEAMKAELRALADKQVISKLITVGAGDEMEATEHERQLLDVLQLSAGFEQRGPVHEEEVSKLLLSAQFGISSQDELSLTKSGSFMAYAAHGLNIISPAAASGKVEPTCWLIAPSELLRGLSPNELRDRAERLRDWQQQTASWPHIAARFAEALHQTHLSRAKER